MTPVTLLRTLVVCILRAIAATTSTVAIAIAVAVAVADADIVFTACVVRRVDEKFFALQHPSSTEYLQLSDVEVNESKVCWLRASRVLKDIHKLPTDIF
uniref:Uncharacterized protein n=1 Tax=Glossina palpalis gambiensis TaxID=67801 RepID=A0A1B0C7I9_9MUSC